MSKHIHIPALLLAATLLLIAAVVSAQDEPGTQGDPIKIAYMRWLQNDIIRDVEEVKRAKDPWERRDLIEDIEEIIWERVEFPLAYQQAELTDLMDLGRIGMSSDVTDAKGAVPEAPQIAVSYALLGIAKGYEGFGAAATDYFQKAKEIYPNVMSIAVSLDHSKDKKPLSEWISASRAYWSSSATTRVSFHGKLGGVMQDVIDKMNLDEIQILPSDKKASPYTLFVARRDFVRGIKRYISTDDSLKERRANEFSVYLEPGEYTIKTSITSTFPIRIKVSRNVNENHFLMETLTGAGITVYPIPDIQLFEAEMKKMMAASRERQEDQDAATDLLGDETGGDEVDNPFE